MPLFAPLGRHLSDLRPSAPVQRLHHSTLHLGKVGVNPTPAELPPGARGFMAPRPAAAKTAEPESVADLFDKALDDVTKK
ncbi:MAG TPA: hypothetical protein VNN25_09685 [Thermoanaerobaculia bacterium]|nr:hypothetical protein [Thermoanaerobaculia bacterium]